MAASIQQHGVLVYVLVRRRPVGGLGLSNVMKTD